MGWTGFSAIAVCFQAYSLIVSTLPGCLYEINYDRGGGGGGGGGHCKAWHISDLSLRCRQIKLIYGFRIKHTDLSKIYTNSSQQGPLVSI